MTLESSLALLLGRCSRQLHKSCAGANMMYSQAEHVFILKHYFASKLCAAVREAFCTMCPDKEVLNKPTIYGLVTKILGNKKCLCVFEKAVDICCKAAL
jgi:hypothetical protein